MWLWISERVGLGWGMADSRIEDVVEALMLDPFFK